MPFPEGVVRPPKKRCTVHCPTCDAHFTSLVAFDMHRVGDECADVSDDDRFVVTIEDGVCELARGEYTPWEKGNTPVFPPGWQPGDPTMQRVREPIQVYGRVIDSLAGREGA